MNYPYPSTGGSVEVFEESVCAACGKTFKTWEAVNWGLVPDKWNPGAYAETGIPSQREAREWARERAAGRAAYWAETCCK